MTKCEFVYESEKYFAESKAILRCVTHNSDVIVTASDMTEAMCIIGKFEMLEERLARLENGVKE